MSQKLIKELSHMAVGAEVAIEDFRREKGNELAKLFGERHRFVALQAYGKMLLLLEEYQTEHPEIELETVFEFVETFLGRLKAELAEDQPVWQSFGNALVSFREEHINWPEDRRAGSNLVFALIQLFAEPFRYTVARVDTNPEPLVMNLETAIIVGWSLAGVTVMIRRKRQLVAFTAIMDILEESV